MISFRKLVFYAILPVLINSFVCFFSYLYNSSIGISSFIVEYRFYRTLYVLLCGGAFAIAGCFLQSTLRNPLVDHYILGIGSGALFASYLVLIAHGYQPFLIVLGAVSGGLIALGLTVSIAERISGSDLAYVLAGIGVTSLFSGLSILTSYYAVVKYPYASLMNTGTFTLATRDRLVYTLTAFILLYWSSLMISKRLNILILGDEFASQLGVNPRTIRLITIIIAGSSASILVAMFGLIGFVGLIAPHVSRLILKTSDNRLVIPIATIIGSLVLYMSDMFSRLVASPVVGEIPAGAIVSAIGAPFFLILILKRFTRGSL